jgi:PTH1 family peptidyl-tRNA hydrolase
MMGRLRQLFGRFRTAPEARSVTAREPERTTRWVIAGLGNPGDRYRRSRHNIGFMVVDYLAAQHGTAGPIQKFKASYREGSLGGASVILVQPQTFYNLSGESISSIIQYFRIPPERLIVVHDDLDLAVGRLRIKRGGGDAGNRGVRSIAQALGTPDFIRARVGIGRPDEGAQAAEHVLAQMGNDELRILQQAIDRAAAAIEAVIAEGLEAAMNRYNQRSQ